MPIDIALTSLAMPLAEFPAIAWKRSRESPVVLPFAPPGPAARASLLRTFRAFP